jgi:transcriptional regulator with XRE-family HTH domain
MADLRQTFGNLLAAHRRHRRLTQEQLASRAGLTVDMINRLEGGKTGASFRSIASLADALDIEPAALFSPNVQVGPTVRPIFNRLVALVAQEDDQTLAWLTGIVQAALKPRR